MDNQIFVKIEEYNEVLDIVKVIKEKIVRAQETISKISELKAEEDKELEIWSKNLETTTSNVAEIEKALGQK
ncbi:MAG: hypothetical protein KKF89_02485 [Nanoarchaeota archaeon]|nr:hypothetical protein [Nanoarchaeota archaeon]MBU1854561.1 hypothetical protein [Nanoarchaeota archaeon]